MLQATDIERRQAGAEVACRFCTQTRCLSALRQSVHEIPFRQPARCIWDIPIAYVPYCDDVQKDQGSQRTDDR